MIEFNHHQLNYPRMIGKQIKDFFLLFCIYFRPTIEVPSYSHLLNHSKSSSDSDTEQLNNDSKKKNSKNSDQSRNKKKSKHVKRQRAVLSSLSSSSDENDNESVWLMSKAIAHTHTSFLYYRLQQPAKMLQKSKHHPQIEFKSNVHHRHLKIQINVQDNDVKKQVLQLNVRTF